MIAPQDALASIPDSLEPAVAGPLLCAGITTFNALRHSGAGPGDLVAIQGVGGLGHLGIQFANKFGNRVAAIGRGKGSEALARKLGAHVYIDSESNPAQELQKLGARDLSYCALGQSHGVVDRWPGVEWHDDGHRRHAG
jgi:D-arabinose 1-dehydrogenase-like Zn-dependent alcohol dehydrogenase